MNRRKLDYLIVLLHPIISFIFVFFVIGRVFEYLGYILGIIYWAILYTLFFCLDIKITIWSFKKLYEPIIYVRNFIIYTILMIFSFYLWENVQYWWDDILYVFIFHTILQWYEIFMMLKTDKKY